MENLMENIISLCKRRGFIFQSSEIYGGVEALWDYGPLGSLLKNNIKNEWLKRFIQNRGDIVLIDATVLMHPKVWEASGHLKNFTDPLVECKSCHKRFRVDKLLEDVYNLSVESLHSDFLTKWGDNLLPRLKNTVLDLEIESAKLKIELEKLKIKAAKINKKLLTADKSIELGKKERAGYKMDINPKKYEGIDFETRDFLRLAKGSTSDFLEYLISENKIPCPNCGKNNFTYPQNFNLMFQTLLGPVENDVNVTYLRPETAQSMFTNFRQVQESMRLKIPFGIGQIGRSFRNEITTGNFTFRSREFDIAEIECFIKPGEDEKWFEYWVDAWEKFFLDLGLKKENLRRYEHSKEALSHYSKRTVDIEYKFPFGWSELAGVANRTDYDLSQHAKFSGQDLSYFDEELKKKYIPYVIEPTLGIERLLLALLVDGYEEIKGGRTQTTKATKEEEVVLKLNKKLAPIKAAIFPLVKNKPELVGKAKEVFESLKPYFMCQYDEVDSIGRRYRRQDEIGTPYCLTCDFETLEKDDVTVRDRDTMQQERVKIKDLASYLKNKLEE